MAASSSPPARDRGDDVAASSDPSFGPSEINERVWEAMSYIKRRARLLDLYQRTTNRTSWTTDPDGPLWELLVNG